MAAAAWPGISISGTTVMCSLGGAGRGGDDLGTVEHGGWRIRDRVDLDWAGDHGESGLRVSKHMRALLFGPDLDLMFPRLQASEGACSGSRRITGLSKVIGGKRHRRAVRILEGGLRNKRFAEAFRRHRVCRFHFGQFEGQVNPVVLLEDLGGLHRLVAFQHHGMDLLDGIEGSRVDRQVVEIAFIPASDAGESQHFRRVRAVVGGLPRLWFHGDRGRMVPTRVHEQRSSDR